MNAAIPLSAGGSLVFEPTTRARPLTATCTLITPAAAELDTPTVTIDPVDTTLDEAALAGDLEIVVADADDIAPRRYYVLRTVAGESALVRVRAVRTVEAVVTVTLYSPLRFDAPEGSVFFGVQLSATVTDEAAATLGEGYEARWEWTTADGTQTGVTRWDVVRSAWPADLVTTADVERYAGATLTGEIQGADAYGLAFLDELERAGDGVRTDIQVQGRRPDLFRSFDAFKTPVIERLLLELAYLGRGIPAVDQNDPAAYRNLRAERYAQALSQALAVTKDYDADESGAADAAEAAARTPLRLVR